MVPTAGADSADRNQASNAQLRIDSLAYNKTAVRATFVAVAGSAAASFIVYLTGVSGFWLVLVTPFIVFITSELVRTQTDKLVTDAQQAVACARDPLRRRKGNLCEGDTESVEWLKVVISKIWPQVNTDLLIPVLDLIEDALVTRMPKIVTAVRVEDLDFGLNAIRYAYYAHHSQYSMYRRAAVKVMAMMSNAILMKS